MANDDHRFWSSLESPHLNKSEKVALIRDFFRPRKLVSAGFVAIGILISFLPDLPDRAVATFALSADGCLLFYAYQDIEKNLLESVWSA